MKILLKKCKLINGFKDIIIEGEKIIDIKPCGNSPLERGATSVAGCVETDFDQIIDIKGNLVIPGVIDPHTHIRDLQQSEKEDWLSASKAALAGGVTTVFDMPNTIPATTNLINLNLKREVAKKTLINYKFFIGATNFNQKDIEEILVSKSTDIAGIKVFLAGSSNNDTVSYNEVLKSIFQIAKKYDKIVTVHTEMQTCLNEWRDRLPYKTVFKHNAIRNRQCSIKGTKLVLELAEKVGNKICIAHCSTKEEIEIIRKYKKNNPVYCEVTPHHLLLNESILEKVGNFGKVNPPLRTEKDNIALWEAIHDGTIDFMGTDHAPHKREEKLLNYSQAPSGLPGLETGLHLLLNEVNKGNLSLEKLVELTSKNASKIFDIQKRGEIKVGNYADLTVIDMNKKWKIDAKEFKTKAKYSPFDGMEVKGKAITTFVNKKMYDFLLMHYEREQI
ncbi:MAG TPA: dihydroorotase [Candidatus Cloacimonetes bacterium]|nr:dihydroorotase [Candidatus Cloacimonadota bacterium]